jgi:hypothetical protein
MRLARNRSSGRLQNFCVDILSMQVEKFHGRLSLIATIVLTSGDQNAEYVFELRKRAGDFAPRRGRSWSGAVCFRLLGDGYG